MKYTGYNSNKFLILFFTATLLWTWIAGFIPVALGLTGTSLGTFIFYFGGGAPSVVALFLVFKTYPKDARSDFFKRCFSLKKMSLKWAALVVSFFVIVSVVGIFISVSILGTEMPEMLWLKIAITQPYMIPLLLFFSLISGPLNEEFGWRGYALDKLLIRFGYAKASAILGSIWAIWHLAWFFTPGQSQYDLLQSSPLEALLFIPRTMILSFVVSFVYLNTKRSILAGAFVHMMDNFFISQLIVPMPIKMRTTIFFVESAFCLLVMIYSLFSSKFKKTVAIELENIKTECEKYSVIRTCE